MGPQVGGGAGHRGEVRPGLEVGSLGAVGRAHEGLVGISREARPDPRYGGVDTLLVQDLGLGGGDSLVLERHLQGSLLAVLPVDLALVVRDGADFEPSAVAKGYGGL